MRTPGQILYDAYCTQAAWLPEWTKIPPESRAAWEYAAQALIDALGCKRPTETDG